MLHEDEDPDTVIGECFLQTLNSGDLALLVDSILANSLGGEDSLFGSEPAGDTWIIWKKVHSDNSHDKSDNSLDDEKPSPSFEARNTVHLEDDNGNQTSECCCEDVTSVKNSNTGCNLLSSIEDREKVKCTTVEGKPCPNVAGRYMTYG